MSAIVEQSRIESEQDQIDEKGSAHQLEQTTHDLSAPTVGDLSYTAEDEEPEIHARTYIALLALFFLNYVQLVALTGPPEVVSPFAAI